MTAFDDERIGDAVYRVMIDTPAITSATHRILLTPVGAPAIIATTAAAMAFTVSNEPGLAWAALAMIPVALFASLPLAASMRSRSLASRAAGSVTTSTAEEGLAQVLAVQSMGASAQQSRHFDRDSVVVVRRLSRRGAHRHGRVPDRLRARLRRGRLGDPARGGAGDRRRHEPRRLPVIFTYFVQAAIAAITLGALWFDLQAASPDSNASSS